MGKLRFRESGKKNHRLNNLSDGLSQSYTTIDMYLLFNHIVRSLDKACELFPFQQVLAKLCKIKRLFD